MTTSTGPNAKEDASPLRAASSSNLQSKGPSQISKEDMEESERSNVCELAPTDGCMHTCICTCGHTYKHVYAQSAGMSGACMCIVHRVQCTRLSVCVFLTLLTDSVSPKASDVCP